MVNSVFLAALIAVAMLIQKNACRKILHKNGFLFLLAITVLRHEEHALIKFMDGYLYG